MDSGPHTAADRRALTFGIGLSLGVGLVMLVIKVGAFWLTGSAAILSDAAESVVHVVAVAFAAASLRISFRPPDASHLYGHAKISFFSAGFEGGLISLAALYIIYIAIQRWLAGIPLERVGLGTLLTAVAVLLNGALGAYLLVLGRRRRSLILTANGQHVLTDCWTSLAVLVGLGLVLLTGWKPFDPICAILMAVNILVSGGKLVRAAYAGLMDQADPAVHRQLEAILTRETTRAGIGYHQLRHRNHGDAHWVEVHLIFPTGTALEDAHRTATAIEAVIEASLQPRACVTTHLESAADHDTVHPHAHAPPAPDDAGRRAS